MNAVAKLFLRKQGITNLKSLFKNIQQSHEQFSTVAEKNYAIGAQSAGLSFSISQETQELIDTAERFAKEEIIPVSKYHDETGEYPWDIVKKAHALGLMNLHVPQEYGGLDLKSLDAVQMVEKLSYGCSGIVQAIDANNLAYMPIALAGNHEQKKKYLSWLIEEPIVCSYGVTEPGAGSDVAGIKTTAVKKGIDLFFSTIFYIWNIIVFIKLQK